MTRNTHPGAPEDKPEHRHYPRAKVIIPVELFSDGSSMPLRVKTADLSIGGLYVEMMFTLNIGTKVKIVLWLNDLKLINSGVVATRDLQVGNGIKFTDLSAEDREKLERFLTQT